MLFSCLSFPPFFPLSSSFWVVFGCPPESIRHLFKGRRSRILASVSIKSLKRQGASFMSTSLSFNNQTMMDYHHTDIRFKAASEGWKTKEEQENTSMLFDSSRIVVGVCMLVCVCLCVFILDASLALGLRKTSSSFSLSFHSLFLSWPLGFRQTAPPVFSLWLSGQDWQGKHLARYPPHLGALGGWMCSIFFIPIWWINALLSPVCLFNLLYLVRFSSAFILHLQTAFLPAGLWTGDIVDSSGISVGV